MTDITELDQFLVHYRKGNNVFSYYKIGDILIPKSTNLYKEQDIKADSVHSTFEDAKFEVLLKNLQNGKSLNNYKRSKYYQYYIERLKEFPEYLV